MPEEGEEAGKTDRQKHRGSERGVIAGDRVEPDRDPGAAGEIGEFHQNAGGPRAGPAVTSWIAHPPEHNA